MKKTNYQPGPRGINLADGGTFWVDPGQEVEISSKDGKQYVEDGDDKREIKGKLPDFGKASDQAEKDASEVEVLREQVETLTKERDALAKDKADLNKQVETLTKPK